MTDQTNEVGAICEAVGGHPLAIELLAARAGTVPLNRLLERVCASADFIAGPKAASHADRRSSIRLCIESSFHGLSSPARDLLHRLCVLPDGASPGVITAVVASQDWDDTAAELVTASVWRLTGRRYTMHPLVRAIALGELGAERRPLERQAAIALAHFIDERTRQNQAFASKPAQLKAALDWCENELRNLVAVADFAFAGAEWGSVCGLSSALFGFFQIRGHWSDCESMSTQALAAGRSSGDRRARPSAAPARLGVPSAGKMVRSGSGLS